MVGSRFLKFNLWTHCLAFALTIFCVQSAFAQDPNDPNDPQFIAETADLASNNVFTEPAQAVEWEKRQNAQDRLTAYGTDLMGDTIDPHTGSISFAHTDISLPGNSNLEVALRRKRSQGFYYDDSVDAEFGDWQYDVPRITVVSTTDHSFPSANCAADFQTLFPHISYGASATMENYQYSTGVLLEMPGGGSEQILNLPSGAGPQWPSTAKHVTKSNWYFSCSGANFIGHAPNGDIYTFDKAYSHQAMNMRYVGAPYVARKVYILAATRVEDVHGNYVKYNYNSSNLLTSITGHKSDNTSDGRTISLTYDVAGYPNLVSSVTANGRTWTYDYEEISFEVPDWQTGGYTQNNDFDGRVLKSVTLPDTKKWEFDLSFMHAQPGPTFKCNVGQNTISVTHPYGTVGKFTLKDTRHRYANNVFVSQSSRCPDPELTPPSHTPAYTSWTSTNVISVTQKRLELNNSSAPDPIWTYTYEKDLSTTPISNASQRTNWTKVQTPSQHITYYHNWVTEPLGGKLVRMEIRPSAESNATTTCNSTMLECQTYEYIVEDDVGTTFMSSGTAIGGQNKPIRDKKTQTIRDGTTFTNEYVYNINQSSSNYSYGYPVSNVSAHGTDLGLG